MNANAACAFALVAMSGVVQSHGHAASPATAPGEASGRGVTIEVALNDQHVLTVAYTRPEGVTRLEFADTDPRAWQLFRSRMLRPLDDCATLNERALVFNPAPRCRTARWRIEPRVLGARAFYEPAQALSDGSALVYTRYLAATAAGHDLRWQFTPPADGYIVHEARLSREPVRLNVPARTVDSVRARMPDDNLEALVGRHYVFLGDAPVDTQAGLIVVRDPALQTALWREVESLASTAIARYTEGLGAPLTAPVAFILTQDDGQPTERPRMVGDVAAAQTIRLRFVRPTAEADAREVETRREFIAHELAHLWNAGLFSSDQSTPWLHEGHAEWASRTMLAEAGLIEPERVREDLELALNRCALVRGDRSAVNLTPGWTSDDDPYACGMALHALAWASARATNPTLSPLRSLAVLHRASPTHDVVAFARHADQGATGFFHRLLLDPRTPFSTSLLSQFTAVGLPMDRRTDFQLDERLRQMVAIRLMSVIVERDCESVRFRPGLDHVWLDPTLRCKSLPGGLRLNSVQGAPMLVLPLRAWAAVNRVCRPGADYREADARTAPPATEAGGLRFHVGAFETTGFALPCGDNFPPPPPIISLRPEAIAWLHLKA